MRVVIVVISLTISAAGCATKAPKSPQPTPVATAPNPPQTSEPAKADTAPPSTKDKGQACGTGPRDAFCVSTCETGCTSFARKACRICSFEACGR